MKNTRCKHSDSFKTEVVLEALKEQKTLDELAQEYQVSPAQISSWKAAFLSNAHLRFGAKHNRAVVADNIHN